MGVREAIAEVRSVLDRIEATLPPRPKPYSVAYSDSEWAWDDIGSATVYCETLEQALHYIGGLPCCVDYKLCKGDAVLLTGRSPHGMVR